MALPPRGRGRFQRETDKTAINERIRARELRVIDEEGEQLGVMSTAQALDTAVSRGLDLVEVSPNAAPPVARIMDYGKFKYEQKKKQSEAKKKQSIIHVKEVKMRPATDQHDFDFKVKNAQRFLQEGDKVKVLITYRGREIMHQHVGRDQMTKIIDSLEPYGQVEHPPKMEGRNLVAILTSKGSKQSK